MIALKTVIDGYAELVPSHCATAEFLLFSLRTKYPSQQSRVHRERCSEVLDFTLLRVSSLDWL